MNSSDKNLTINWVRGDFYFASPLESKYTIINAIRNPFRFFDFDVNKIDNEKQDNPIKRL